MDIFGERLTSYKWNSEFVIFAVALAVFSVLVNYYSRWRKDLPPGPWGLPLIGYRPFLGQNLHKQFKELGKRYGPIFGISIGQIYVVVLNTFETTTEVFRKEETTGRPSQAFHNLSKFEHFGTANGLLWKEHRKRFTGYFRNLFRADAGYPHLQTILYEEISEFISVLRKGDKDTVVNIREYLREGTNNTLYKYLFGRSLPNDHPFVKATFEQQRRILDQGNITAITLYFAKLRFIWNRIFPEQIKLKNSTKQAEDFIRNEIEMHKKTLDPDNPRDYIDLCLLRQRSNKNSELYNDGFLNSDIQIILTGGTDTVRTSMEWMFLFMAEHQHIQDRIYQEIKEVFGRDQKPKWEDRYKLPYTVATIMEGQRYKPLLPVSSVRCAVEEFKVQGYRIPKGTVLVSNIWAIHNDETYWDKPSEFNPEHYLMKDGTLKVNERLFSFSFGKRDCPGKNQAMMELFLYLTAVIQQFKILPPPEGVSFEEYSGVVLWPLKPYIRFEARV